MTFMAVLGLVTLCSWGGAAAGAGQERAGIAGAWVGVYQSYPTFVRMGLQISPGADGAPAEGELRLEPLVAQRSITRGPMGVVSVLVHYDAAAQTVRIVPAADAYRQIGARIPEFSGVLDAQTGVVGGMLAGAPSSASPYFVLGRAETAEAAFLKNIRERVQATTAARGRANLRNPFGGGGIGTDKIRQWAARLTTEYPDIDPYRTEQGRLFLMARNLFRDDHFKAYFGKPFDELGRADLERITAEIRKVPPPRSNFPEERANGTVRAIDRAFMPMIGTYAAPDITVSVAAMRPMAAWRAQALARLGTMEADADVLAAITAIEVAEQEALQTFWPSERTEFAEAVTQTRTRVATPVLLARVNELIAAPASLAAARALDSAIQASASRAEAPVSRPAASSGARGGPPLPPRRGMPSANRGAAGSGSGAPAGDLASLMALASDAVKQQQRLRLQARLGEVLGEEVQVDRAALDELGTGKEGLEAGVRWRSQVSQKYGPLVGHEVVRGLMDEFAARRAPLLQGEEQALMTRVQSASSTAQLDAIVASALGVPSDRTDPAGRRVLQAVDERRVVLGQAESAAAAEQAVKAAEAASACATVPADPGEVPGEPTAREMCRAIERTFGAANEVSKSMQGACDSVGPRSDPMTALTCLMGSAGQIGGGPQVSIRQFQKIACVSAASAGRPGFFCDYALQIRTGNQMLAPMVSRLPGSVNTARFVRSSGAWLMLPTK